MRAYTDMVNDVGQKRKEAMLRRIEELRVQHQAEEEDERSKAASEAQALGMSVDAGAQNKRGETSEPERGGPAAKVSEKGPDAE